MFRCNPVSMLLLFAWMAAGDCHAANSTRVEDQGPPALLRAIRALSGTWSIIEQYPPSATFPQGGIGRGTEVWRAGPGNITLADEYHSTNPGGEMWATAVLWWDSKKNKFGELWCTSRNSTGCVVSTADIHWEGDDLVFTDSYEVNGERVFSRETWSELKTDAHTMTIAESPEVGHLKAWIISHAVRVR